ncbi:MAG TPA: cytidine deaminase [Puia sp.]|nr:cytidine deaminase [Puia sp.]
MRKKELRLEYEEYASDGELPASDAILLTRAREATGDAYAPYSRFRVGAAARLANGEVITGSNQENASFPAGICAERTLLSAAASKFPGVGIETLAISYSNGKGASDRPISPCGICRQSLQEAEARTGRPIRLVLGGMEGKVIVLPEAGQLLPLAFTSGELGA